MALKGTGQSELAIASRAQVSMIEQVCQQEKRSSYSHKAARLVPTRSGT